MSNQTILSIIVVIVVVVGGYFLLAQTPAQAPTENETATTTENGTSAPHESTNPGSTSTSTTGNTQTYTLAQVATHKDATSCWSTVRGDVYDLTNWIKNHPGGQQAILSICGKDGTQAFVNQHGGSSQQETLLATFKIGSLAQ